ncbi:iron-sulfur cluster repair di-iron protein [Tenacibaculum xiamenense]|uniref:iron-sulfur cluster repair di-iron protein n=1 Tax=Tenacibaculum xiamenense TaxID=1261553 RepID=UPI003894AD7F
MIISKSKTVANYVTENIKTAHIFKKHGIDFCCGGNISLEKACEKNEINFKTLLKELSCVDVVNDVNEDYDNWDLDFLMTHIENKHHTYVRDSLPILSEYANKVAKVHGTHYPEVLKINKLFHEVANELISHLQKEEQILFPFIKQLVVAKKEGRKRVTPPFGTINNPINMMEHEHDNAGDVFKTIAKLTNRYSPPPHACNTFRALYSKLQEFEQDLHKHIHLENNILHPKAIALENELRT